MKAKPGFLETNIFLNQIFIDNNGIVAVFNNQF